MLLNMTIMFFIITFAFLIFLLMELDFKTGEWKKERYKGKIFPL